MIYWIWLTQIPFIGPVTARYLIKELGDAEKIYQADYKTLSKMSGLSARQKKYHQESFIGKGEKDSG